MASGFPLQLSISHCEGLGFRSQLSWHPSGAFVVGLGDVCGLRILMRATGRVGLWELRNASQSWTLLDIISFNSVVSAGEKAYKESDP